MAEATKRTSLRLLDLSLGHPLMDRPVPAETGPAPMPGEHTYEICRRVLGLSTEQIDGLICDGALFANQATS